eukprot:9697-Heterococcus_DN1.PRE.2
MQQCLTSRSSRLTVSALPIAMLRSMSRPSGAKLRSASSHAEPVVPRLCTSLNLFSAGVSPLSSACMSVTLTAMNSSIDCSHTSTGCHLAQCHTRALNSHLKHCHTAHKAPKVVRNSSTYMLTHYNEPVIDYHAYTPSTYSPATTARIQALQLHRTETSVRSKAQQLSTAAISKKTSAPTKCSAAIAPPCTANGVPTRGTMISTVQNDIHVDNALHSNAVLMHHLHQYQQAIITQAKFTLRVVIPSGACCSALKLYCKFTEAADHICDQMLSLLITIVGCLLRQAFMLTRVWPFRTAHVNTALMQAAESRFAQLCHTQCAAATMNVVQLAPLHCNVNAAAAVRPCSLLAVVELHVTAVCSQCLLLHQYTAGHLLALLHTHSGTDSFRSWQLCYENAVSSCAAVLTGPCRLHTALRIHDILCRSQPALSLLHAADWQCHSALCVSHLNDVYNTVALKLSRRKPAVVSSSQQLTKVRLARSGVVQQYMHIRVTAHTRCSLTFVATCNIDKPSLNIRARTDVVLLLHQYNDVYSSI